MGMKENIVLYFGQQAVEELEKKDPAVFLFLDKLNEMPLIEAFRVYLEYKANNPKVKESGVPIDYTKYLIRVIGEPFTIVLQDFLEESGFKEIMGIAVPSLIASLTEIGSDKE